MADRNRAPLSVVAAARNEQDNVVPLVGEIHDVLDRHGLEHEVVVVDDGSTDGTRQRLRELLRSDERLRAVGLCDPPRGRGHGQSAAFGAGIRAARGAVIALIDADLQNDPADLPDLLQRLESDGVDLVQGDRTAARRDGPLRRASSFVGRLVRRWLLSDPIRDTGCSLRVMRRELALALPLHYRGLHRFIPVVAADLGYRVLEVPVGHRPRVAGRTKYGVRARALPGLIDCLAVRWMRSRRQDVTFREITAEAAS